VILVTHRTHVLVQADQLMVLEEGKVRAFGPRSQVLESLSRTREAASKAAIQSPRKTGA